MRRRQHDFLWLLVASAFLVQSLLPVAALAEVSMRCAGMPAASAPCVRMVVSPADRNAISTRLSGMACCRDMVSSRAMTSGCDKHTPAALRLTSCFSTPKCLLIINALGTTSAANVPSVHRWLLHSTPALAPPAVYSVAALLAHASVPTVLPAVFTLTPRLRTASHGLRAPPA